MNKYCVIAVCERELQTCQLCKNFDSALKLMCELFVAHFDNLGYEEGPSAEEMLHFYEEQKNFGDEEYLSEDGDWGYNCTEENSLAWSNVDDQNFDIYIEEVSETPKSPLSNCEIKMCSLSDNLVSFWIDDSVSDTFDLPQYLGIALGEDSYLTLSGSYTKANKTITVNVCMETPDKEEPEIKEIELSKNDKAYIIAKINQM